MTPEKVLIVERMSDVKVTPGPPALVNAHGLISAALNILSRPKDPAMVERLTWRLRDPLKDIDDFLKTTPETER